MYVDEKIKKIHKEEKQTIWKSLFLIKRSTKKKKLLTFENKYFLSIYDFAHMTFEELWRWP